MQETKLYGGKVTVRFNPETHIYTVDSGEGKFARKVGCTTVTGILDKSGALIPWAVGLAVDFVKEHKELLDGNDSDEIFALAEEEAEKKKNEASDLGTLVHTWVSNDILGVAQDMPDDERVVRGAMAWLDWRDAHKAKITRSETPVYSLEHDYVGTLDFTANITSCGGMCCGETAKGTPLNVLGDIKTGNNIYESHGMQTAGYHSALVEETKEKFDGRVIVRLSKETEEDFNERMAKKNAKREKQGKKTFDAKFHVVETVWMDAGEGLEEDTKAFINALGLYRWQYQASKRLKLAKGL